jgi:hypothetical protein
MKITTILSTHGIPEITADTLDSIRCYMTDEVMLLIDGFGYDKFDNVALPAYKLKGFNHGFWKSPYRNIVLGLYAASQQFKDSDWYCYMEYDCLVGSSIFKKDLEEAEKEGIWLLGNDLRFNQEKEKGVDLRMLEKIVGGQVEEIIYFLGACLFYHKDFIKVALEKEFFQRFLYYTNDFRKDFFPFYTAWDLTEHALPTVVKHFGGKVKQLACYNKNVGKWTGNYRRYPIRFRPELPYEEEYFLQSSIMHPIKELDHPIRKYHRAKRSAKRKGEIR